jgi:hypothetical protein
MENATEIIKSFEVCLRDHIEFCVEDQLEEFNNKVSIDDYTPLYKNLADFIYSELDMMNDDIEVFDEQWDKIHDKIDFYDFVECSNNVVDKVPNYETVVIKDANVINIWGSSNDSDIEVALTPDWYEENGTPIDDEGDDMIYIRTEIRISNNEEFNDTIKLINQRLNYMKM